MAPTRIEIKKAAEVALQLCRIPDKNREQFRDLYDSIDILAANTNPYTITRTQTVLTEVMKPFIIEICGEVNRKHAKRYYPRILHKDILQEGYILLYEFLEKYNPKRGGFVAFLKYFFRGTLGRRVDEWVEYIHKTPVSLGFISQAHECPYSLIEGALCMDYWEDIQKEILALTKKN